MRKEREGEVALVGGKGCEREGEGERASIRAKKEM